MIRRILRRIFRMTTERRAVERIVITPAEQAELSEARRRLDHKRRVFDGLIGPHLPADYRRYDGALRASR